MDLSQSIILLWYGSILFLAILWIKLLVTGLYQIYPSFTLYIFALFAESLLLAFLLKYHPQPYATVWTISRIIILVLQSAAVLSVFGRWTVSFPGIGAFGRRLMFLLILISIGIACSTLPIAWPKDVWRFALQAMVLVNRGVFAGCAGFLLLTLWFFSKFGGPVAPNVKRHTWALSAFVTANTISYFILSGHAVAVANVLLQLVSLSALGFWIVALTKSGEVQPSTALNEEEWEDAEQWNRQLQKLADSITLSSHGLKKKK